VQNPGGRQAGAVETCAPASLADCAPALDETLADPKLLGFTFPMRRVRPREALVRAGDRCDAIHVIRHGFFKSVRIDEAGNEVVLGLALTGETIGLEGIEPGRYVADVIALDTGFVGVVSFARLMQLGREHSLVERAIYRAFSRELERKHRRIWMLCALNAEARLADFLLDLSERLGRPGHSRTTFALHMSRREIGSYLALRLETVSRAFSALAARGLLSVDRKTVILTDIPALRRFAKPQGQEWGGHVRPDEDPRSHHRVRPDLPRLHPPQSE